jgi:CubicO group peptidase (beta-lactamase class C family)
MPGMLKPVTVDGILDRWARRPLDFEPGTQYQYSNTGFVIVGLIVERASGRSFMEFLQERIFTPLKMKTVIDADQHDLTGSDAVGYMRYGLGPRHPAPRTGKGWLFAAGALAMTAEDLARWNLSVINQTLLKPQSYREMQSAVILKNGLASNYGLGVSVRRSGMRRVVAHNGMVSGFVSQNVIYPEDRAAVVVLTNGEAGAAGDIQERIARLLFADQGTENAEQQARLIFQDLQRGRIDRTRFTDNANYYFTDAALREMAAGLKRLGKPRAFTQVSRIERGGMTGRFFEVQFARRKLEVAQYTLPNGKIEQYLVAPSE